MLWIRWWCLVCSSHLRCMLAQFIDHHENIINIWVLENRLCSGRADRTGNALWSLSLSYLFVRLPSCAINLCAIVQMCEFQSALNAPERMRSKEAHIRIYCALPDCWAFSSTNQMPKSSHDAPIQINNLYILHSTHRAQYYVLIFSNLLALWFWHWCDAASSIKLIFILYANWIIWCIWMGRTRVATESV